MLYKNDIFEMREHRFRLLHCVAQEDIAWVIDVDDPKAWPIQVSWQFICKLKPLTRGVGDASLDEPLDGTDDESARDPKPKLRAAHATAAAICVRDRAMEILGDLPQKTDQIFDRRMRTQLVRERAQASGSTMPTVYKHLRRYWVGGQTASALLGDFHICGRSGGGGLTGRRGAKPEFDRPAYQLTERDANAFVQAIKHYLSDQRLSITMCFQRLLENAYTALDGNGESFLLSEGERPTQRQFEYYLRKNYPVNVRNRARLRDKDFERDHRAVLGTVLDDCLGVGHYYEADATIVDNYLVAADDIRKLIGKPTLYLIIDRKSRLIVGWYVGLENASWICAMQAFLSISQDKEAICKRLGVEYRAEDWPAHQVFPKCVLADRSEVLTKNSDQLASDLDVKVANVPSKRPDWKPVIETEFKQTRMTLQAGAPGFDPPENATARQGKRYDKDGCLTLAQFEKIILEAIIAHNRRPLLDYSLSLKEIGDEVAPIPIDLWNHGIVERSGLLPRYSEKRVRMALLQRAQGSVSETGISFGHCLYACAEMVSGGWFERARARKFKVDLSFDRRLVDRIYVRDPAQPGKIYTCQLTTASEKYRGLSFCEVEAIEKLVRASNVKHKQTRHEVTARFNKNVAPVYSDAKQTLKDAKLSSSRAHRKADTKAARAQELRSERQRLADSSTPMPTPAGNSGAKVIALADHVAVANANAQSEAQSASTSTAAPSATHQLTHKELLSQIKQRMFHG